MISPSKQEKKLHIDDFDPSLDTIDRINFSKTERSSMDLSRKYVQKFIFNV